MGRGYCVKVVRRYDELAAMVTRIKTGEAKKICRNAQEQVKTKTKTIFSVKLVNFLNIIVSLIDNLIIYFYFGHCRQDSE